MICIKNFRATIVDIIVDIAYKQVMVSLNSKNISDLRNIALQASEAVCMDDLRSRLVNLVHRAFDSTSTIFWLINEEKTMVDPMMKGIQNQFLLPYKSHFFLQNPFDPTNISELNRPSVAMEQLIPLRHFHKTEYFNDFLKPQKIHRQMAVYIRQGKSLKGVIGMHRCIKKRFEEKFLFMGDLISAQLTASFENMRLLEEIDRSRDIMTMVQENRSTGFILLDENLQPIFLNTKAEQICSRLAKKFAPYDGRNDIKCRIPEIILQDCKSGIGSPLQLKERRLSVSPGEIYSVKNQPVKSDLLDHRKGMLLVTLEDEIPDINPDFLKSRFKLTPREIEIISYIYKGFTNREIADTLFISEGTVKNHLKHIFAKTHASNRTNLIHMVIYSPVRQF